MIIKGTLTAQAGIDKFVVRYRTPIGMGSALVLISNPAERAVCARILGQPNSIELEGYVENLGQRNPYIVPSRVEVTVE